MHTMIDPTCRIDSTSLINYQGEANDPSVSIGPRARIGAFCIVEPGAEIGEDVEIYHHCVIGRNARVGPRTKLVDRARIAMNAKVGADCIVGGNVSERAILEDRVTFMGEMAHSHRDPMNDWEMTDEPSCIIRAGTVIAQGAWVIGGISIGPNSYVSVGEIVKWDVPSDVVVISGKQVPLADFRGLVRARGIPKSSGVADMKRGLT
jgi:UDP-3-O-[3-hydroxymyristoyl] glucosamine N-acyltransferase